MGLKDIDGPFRFAEGSINVYHIFQAPELDKIRLVPIS
jgi:hypothetical protein